MLGHVRSFFFTLRAREADSDLYTFRFAFTGVAENQDAVTAIPAHDGDVPLTWENTLHGWVISFALGCTQGRGMAWREVTR